MGRARIILKHVQDQEAHKVAFMQRRKRLMKKTSDFSTMCGVEACLVVYDGDDNADGPVTWPQEHTVIHSILEKYEHQKNEKPPKTFDLKDYFQIKKDMVEDEISRVQKQILKAKYPTWDPFFSNIGEEQLRAFIATLDAKIGACDHRISMLKNMQQSEAQNMAHMQSKASQLNVMQNISQSHILAPMEPLDDTCL